jgi:uroporphyrinogen decarboxylase
MTSRERVRAALNHKEADKIPVDCGGMRSTVLLGATYNKLKKHLGITQGETKIYDMVQQLALVEDWYMDMFQIDVIDLARGFADNADEWNDWKLPDGSGAKIPAWLRIEKDGDSWFCVDDDGERVAEMPSGSYFFDQKIWPLYGQTPDNFDNLPDVLKKIMWVHMSDPQAQHGGESDYYEQVGRTAKKLYESTDYAIMAGFGGQFFELGGFIYRMDDFMTNLVINRPMMEKLFDRLLELHMEKLKPYLEAIAPYADAIVMGDDLGTQTSPMISPVLYRDLILPRARELYRYVRENSDVKVFLHSCGAIAPFLPDLIDAGVQIINPVQTSAGGMEPEKLKRDFGKDLVFWGGGIDTQRILPEASPDEVRREVRRNCEIFMKDGGFVFCQIHNMLDTVPPENIVAMYETVNGMRY